MSKSLQLINGDLVASGRSYKTVSGQAKLGQDLVLWLQERVGQDPSYPTYGTALDGGVINGIPQESMIGQPITLGLLGKIKQELASVLSLYQQLQFNKIRTETFLYNGQTTITPDEAIETIDSIDVRATGTLVLAQVKITTAAGTALRLTLPLNNNA